MIFPRSGVVFLIYVYALFGVSTQRLSIFTVPDDPHSSIHQIFTITSWLNLSPVPDVFLLGPHASNTHTSLKTNLDPQQMASLERVFVPGKGSPTLVGVPTLSPAIRLMDLLARSDYYVYLPPNIVLFQDWMNTLWSVISELEKHKLNNFLMIGRTWKTKPAQFFYDRKVSSTTRLLEFKTHYTDSSRQPIVDGDIPMYMIFKRNFFNPRVLPNFPLGSRGWPSWIVASVETNSVGLVRDSNPLVVDLAEISKTFLVEPPGTTSEIFLDIPPV
eukprot:TRINITY_DN5627_c1_g1_i5.p1 TRINITY_DN5627_c1_g1~~TRINITY_DN5627_c1_g1_i5.p1  ORF type:complete len:291 (-),score=49.11 TRINITY_DN5627_c1_g1_i5:1354-2172(-)